MRDRDRLRMFWPGPLEQASLTVLKVLEGPTLRVTRYRVRYDCCGTVGVLRHQGLQLRIHRCALADEYGAPRPVCRRCTREGQVVNRKVRPAADLGSLSHWPLWGGDHHGYVRPPITPAEWPKPRSATGGLWADAAGRGDG